MFTQENVIRGEGSITSRCSGDELTILPRENRENSGDLETVVVYEFKIGVLTVFLDNIDNN